MFVGPMQKSRWWRQFSVVSRRARRHYFFQIFLILAFWQVGETIVRVAHLPLPGAIIGFLVVLGLLLSGRANPASFQLGAGWFLSQLLLFLMPTALALLDHPEFISWLGLKILMAILLGTLAVMLVTALAIDLAYRLHFKLQNKSCA